MTTSTYVSQLDAISKKVESFIQSLQNAEIHPSKEQYTTFKALSLRLCEASADIPVEIEALKKRQAESCEEGRRLISQAQSDRKDLVHLKNRSVFARNLKLFFGGPQESAIDSDAIKARKKLTRERCERICKLSPDGLISWAMAFAPSLWTANLMSNKTFHCVEELIEPQGPAVWPPEIYDVLSALGDEDPLRGSQKYHEFLKGKFYLVRKLDRKIYAFEAYLPGTFGIRGETMRNILFFSSSKSFVAFLNTHTHVSYKYIEGSNMEVQNI
tara:strand:- start:118 stop:930 length:813 start_codon:yes stop_codon:yes gene_type:complete